MEHPLLKHPATKKEKQMEEIIPHQFPGDFMFQLVKEEIRLMVLQIVNPPIKQLSLCINCDTLKETRE